MALILLMRSGFPGLTNMYAFFLTWHALDIKCSQSVVFKSYKILCILNKNRVNKILKVEGKTSLPIFLWDINCMRHFY